MKFALYDGKDADGHACRAILESVGYKCLPYSYSNPLPEGLNYEDIGVIADISMPADMMWRWGQENPNALWIDHHVSSYEEIQEDFIGNIIYDPSVSAAMLAWKHFYPSEIVPSNVVEISRFDVWDHRLRTIRHSLGWASYSKECGFEGLRSETFYNAAIQTGQMIERYLEKEVYPCLERHCKVCFLSNICGVSVNSCLPSNLISIFLGEKCKEYPYAVAYRKGWDGAWYYSIRSNGNIDVSEIAKGFGGGGHKSSAGFRTERLVIS